MPVLRPRNRLVNFRLSEEEYAALQGACALNGARSLSEFARLAVLRCAGLGEGPRGAVERRLSALHRKVTELEDHIRDLRQLLKTLEGQGRAAQPPAAASEFPTGVTFP